MIYNDNYNTTILDEFHVNCWTYETMNNLNSSYSNKHKQTEPLEMAAQVVFVLTCQSEGRHPLKLRLLQPLPHSPEGLPA